MRKFPRFSSSRRAFALVITLAAVALLTVLIVAFLSRALLNRQVAFTSTNMVKTDLLARSALDLVVGEIRQEIRDGSTVRTIDGVTTFQPLSGTHSLPRKMGVTGADPDVGKYTIAKVSADDTPLSPGGMPLGSGVTLDQRSVNGRTAASWYATGPNLGTADLPHWVYLGREGVVVNPSVADARNRDGNYVIGRFAYTVYNTAGLLDANLAGYPVNTPFTFPPAEAAARSSITHADLSVLGLPQAKIDELVSWRNPVTAEDLATYSEWTTGMPRVSGTSNPLALAAGRSGRILLAAGDQGFFSRKDLLRYASQHGWDPAASSFLTHVSREVEGPVWTPKNPPGSAVPVPNYETSADSVASTNRNLAGLRHTSSSATAITSRYNDDGTEKDITVKEGEPFIQSRFSLARLAWLGRDGPEDSAFHDSLSSVKKTEAIRDCFGLAWNGSFKRWDYDHGSPGRIMTLEEVLAAGREPDFFELLKAVILSGSLGKHPGSATTGPMLAYGAISANVEGVLGYDFENYSSIADLQILQIGANIIDQADEGNFPTAIFLAVPPPRVYGEGHLYQTVYGIENLPYLSRLGLITVCRVDAAVGQPQTWGTWLQPEVWNPHQSPGSDYPSSTGRNATPSQLRISTYGNCYAMNTIDPRGTPALKNPGDPVDFGEGGSPTNQGIITFNNLPDFFSNPRALTTANAASAVARNNYNYAGSIVPFASNPFVAFWTGDVERVKPPSPLANRMMIVPDTHLTFVLEYFDGASWRPYSIMARITEITAQSFASGTPNGGAWKEFVTRPDPRTDRFSSSSGWNQAPVWKMNETIRKDSGNPNAVRFGYPRPSAGFHYKTLNSPTASSAANNQLFFHQWAANLPTSDYRYLDPDGIVRPGDGARADEAYGDGMMLYHGNNSLASVQLPRRPVVLNRPFRSVGELGYVFRDLPFKTLDLWASGSPDAGLLEVFSVAQTEGEVRAGGVNPAVAPPKALQAILQGAAKSTDGAVRIDAAAAAAVAAQIAGTPLSDRSGMVFELGDGINDSLLQTIDKSNKTYAESPVRALASVAQMRTWNLLIDLVAQSGRLSESARGLEDFIVEGEKRYWLHLAVDRYTGKVVFSQLEPVYE